MIFGLEFTTQQLILGFDLLILDPLFHAHYQLFKLKWLFQIVIRSSTRSLNGRSNTAVAGHDDDNGFGEKRKRFFENCIARLCPASGDP